MHENGSEDEIPGLGAGGGLQGRTARPTCDSHTSNCDALFLEPSKESSALYCPDACRKRPHVKKRQLVSR